MASRDVDLTGHAVDLSPVAYVPMLMLREGETADQLGRCRDLPILRLRSLKSGRPAHTPYDLLGKTRTLQVPSQRGVP